MYKLQLTENGWIQGFLVSQPECGMGYQLVELHLEGGCIIPEVLVLDGQVICLPDSHHNIVEEDIIKIVMPSGIFRNNPRKS